MLGEGMPEDKKAQMMEEVRAFLIARQPIPRQGTTDDIAETAIFFASDRSSYMTGQIMCVDGGMLTGNPQPAEGLQEILPRYRGEPGTPLRSGMVELWVPARRSKKVRSMGMNAIEKILANHSAEDRVSPGDVVVVDVDVTVQFDFCRSDVLRIANPEKLVLMHDHVVPAPTVLAANNAKAMREFVDRFDIPHYFPVGQHGISHVIVAQEGYALPGQILVNADSHTCSSGAMNCLARGMGPSEMLYILCKGQTWYQVGPTTKVVLTGALPDRVYARDVIHYIPGQYGDFAGRNLEWYGDGLTNIGIDGRLTMATISAELSVEFSLFPYDDVLAQYLEGRAKWDSNPRSPTTTPSTSTSSRSTSRRSSPKWSFPARSRGT